MITEPATEPFLGIVIIGRNEGARLVRCFASVGTFKGPIVYVDSGSTDRSVAAAIQAGAQVVQLDMSYPFTAARARNAGLAKLGVTVSKDAQTDTNPPEFIQFIDGDCEMHQDWLQTAQTFLQSAPDVGVVCGRLRERHSDASWYNALCDFEWDAPAGEHDSCGGIAMMRREALTQAHLFDARMIAGEEPELCLRIRRNGWKIWRLEDDMAQHDADMHRFAQFWKRMRRGGFAFALWFDMYGRAPEQLGAAQLRRALLWGLILPVVIVCAALFGGAWALLLLLVYPVQIIRMTRRGTGWRNALLLSVGKFAEAQGVLEFYWHKLRGQQPRIIEHK